MRDLFLKTFLIFSLLLPHYLFSENFQQKVGQVEATLLAEPSSIASGKSFTIAIRLRMDSKWHTYWKNPGDAGFATQIEWNLPPGFQAGEIQWPYPEQVVVGGIVSYAYHNEAWLLTQITPPQKLPPTIPIQAKVSWLMCEETCIPGEATLTISLPSGVGEIKPETKALFDAARETLPKENQSLNLKVFKGSDKKVVLSIASEDFNANTAYFFPDTPEQIAHDAPQIVRQISPSQYEIELTQATIAPATLERLRGVLIYQTPQEETKAFQIDAPIQTENSTLTLNFSWKENLLYLLYAFLGGIILNLMPCVLPVISLKIFNFIQQSHHDSKKILAHGLIFSAGIILSFLALASALIALRAGGEKIGWGFQFQSPIFLIVLSAIVLVMSLALFNVFVIGGSLVGVGSSLTAQGGLRGSFFNGVLATTLATPCTAPFMGAALGFALTQPAWLALSIFSSLGLGMALPYLLISAQPKLLRYLPKPGIWMEIFKQFTGFLMFGTLLWLLWLFGTTQGIDALILLCVFLLVLAFCCWLIGQFGTPIKTRRSKIITWLLSLFLIASAGHFFIKPLLGSEKIKQTSSQMDWKPYSPQALQNALQTTQPIFIDFTADWCLSCKVNERVALNIDQTQKLFERHQVIAFKADWTTRNPEVSEALASYGRAGVPFYLFYPADRSKSPVILPEILTPQIIANLFTEK
ncbi:MAG: thioredoxin family protein [Verrucomicrobiae bacterium]|nr:thioredoxin family protein [Verrucomicrobiae bacterium]